MYSTVKLKLWWILVWTSRYCLSAEVLRRNVYFLAGQKDKIILETDCTSSKETEFRWELTSHDSRYQNATIAVIKGYTWQFNWKISSFEKYSTCSITMNRKFENGGVFTFTLTKPKYVQLEQFVVFAVKVTREWQTVPLGSDVSLSCEVSRLPESVTLQWEKEGDPTANTTLLFNNTAYIIIHDFSQHSQGTYNCTLRENGEELYRVYTTHLVKQNTYASPHTVFRECSNSSDLLLNCRSLTTYRKASWNWKPVSGASVIMAESERNMAVEISKTFDKERVSAKVFNGVDFALRISSVQFGDRGGYTCYFENSLFAHVTLITVQVSVEPRSGISRNKTTTLNCEVSNVIGSVTLAWLRMEGHRAVLVKQEVLEENQPNRKLILNLSSLSEDQLYWECVVFKDSMLRAKSSLHLTLPTLSTNPDPKSISLPLMVVSSVGAVFVAVLLGAVALYCKRKAAVAASSSSVTTEKVTAQTEGIYCSVTDLHEDIGRTRFDDPVTQQNMTEDENIHYSSFSFGRSVSDPKRQMLREEQSHTEHEDIELVVYSEIKLMHRKHSSSGSLCE